MANNDLQHSIEIEGYWREMPSGRKVWVKSYSRKGTAAEDDRARKADNLRRANRAAETRVVRWQRAGAEYQRLKDGGKPRETIPLVYNKMLGNAEKKLNEAEREAIDYQHKYGEALSDFKKDPTTFDKMQFAAIDVKEEVEVFVNNAIEEASFGAQAAADIVVGASKKVVEVVTSGWNAVKSFFGGLFGRR